MAAKGKGLEEEKRKTCEYSLNLIQLAQIEVSNKVSSNQMSFVCLSAHDNHIINKINSMPVTTATGRIFKDDSVTGKKRKQHL